MLWIFCAADISSRNHGKQAVRLAEHDVVTMRVRAPMHSSGGGMTLDVLGTSLGNELGLWHY